MSFVFTGNAVTLVVSPKQQVYALIKAALNSAKEECDDFEEEYGRRWRNDHIYSENSIHDAKRHYQDKKKHTKALKALLDKASSGQSIDDSIADLSLLEPTWNNREIDLNIAIEAAKKYPVLLQ